MHKNYNKKQQNTKPHHTINVIESAIEKQSNILSTLAEKLSLFDVPKVTLTVVAIMTLFTPCLAWECEQIPPFYPLTYDQFEYTFSAFHKIEISEMIDICIAGEFRPVYKLGNIIIDMTTTPHIETKINDTNIDDCKPNILYTNSSNNDMFLRKPDPLTLTKDDQNILLEIYSYHRNFNYTCSSVMEVEMTIPEGKLVPTSSHRKRKRINNPDKTGDDCDELQKLADTAGERIKATNDALLLHQEMFDATKKELEMANQQISVFEDETKTAKRTIESQKNTIEQNKQTIVTITDQLAKVETSFNQARRTIESQKDELTDYKNKLIIKNDEVNSLETTIRLRDATISSLKNEIQHYNENLRNTQTTAEGAQNAALQAEQNHARQISKLRKEHETTITELERQHKLNMDNKISELTKLHNENIQNAIQIEIAKCESQRRHDAKQWNTETEKFKSECQLQRDAEIDNMKKIFDEQIKSLMNSVQFKVEAMETDDIKDGNQLLAKLKNSQKKSYSLNNDLKYVLRLNLQILRHQ
uniref:Coiled-coil domain-containing protein 147 n=1 Tax=Strongyloides papillosus TaxID=174720 RepID=A0A0N5CI90_STREA